MIPHAKHGFDWEDLGERYYNVVDGNSSVYANGSTISTKTVKALGLPIVETAEDEEAHIRLVNAAFLGIRDLK